MPRGPALLKVTEPDRSDYADVPEAIWQFPHRIVRRAAELGINGQKGLAERVKLKQPVVSKTLNYGNIRKLNATTVMAYAIGLECPMGWLFYGEGESVPTIRVVPPMRLPAGKTDNVRRDAGTRGSNVGDPGSRRYVISDAEKDAFPKTQKKRFRASQPPSGGHAKTSED